MRDFSVVDLIVIFKQNVAFPYAIPEKLLILVIVKHGDNFVNFWHVLDKSDFLFS